MSAGPFSRGEIGGLRPLGGAAAGIVHLDHGAYSNHQGDGRDGPPWPQEKRTKPCKNSLQSPPASPPWPSPPRPPPRGSSTTPVSSATSAALSSSLPTTPSA